MRPQLTSDFFKIITCNCLLHAAKFFSWNVTKSNFNKYFAKFVNCFSKCFPYLILLYWDIDRYTTWYRTKQIHTFRCRQCRLFRRYTGREENTSRNNHYCLLTVWRKWFKYTTWYSQCNWKVSEDVASIFYITCTMSYAKKMEDMLSDSSNQLRGK